MNIKPSAVNEISGSYVRHPERRRPNEPNTGRGIGPAPASLSPKQRETWDEIVGNCAAGVFQSSDRAAVEVLAVMLTQFRAGRAKFTTSRLSVMIGLMGRCGMDPVSRTKVGVPPRDGKAEEKPKSGLASFRR
jgi:hypothetical protein